MARAFIQDGVWRMEPAPIVDAPAQQRATLRVSALAALATLALAGASVSPTASAGSFAKAQPPSRAVIIAMPEMVSAKLEDRVPTQAGPISPLRRRTADGEAATGFPEAIAVTAGVTSGIARTVTTAREAEALEPAVIRTGDGVFRLAGIMPPDQSRMCRRLDGLAVPCIDRAQSYLQLLMKGRAVTCAPLSQKGETGAPAPAHCRVGDADLGEQMVRQGWASAAPQPEERFLMAEEAARRQRVGLWRE